MKRRIILTGLAFFILSAFPALSEAGGDEYAYLTFPLGGWNTLGPASTRSIAMGETLLSSQTASAGYLNPAVLSLVSRPLFSLSSKNATNRLRLSLYQWGMEPIGAVNLTRTIGAVDSVGFALPLREAVFAISYFTRQEYDYPDILAGFGGPMRQSGDMKAVNFALALRPTPSLSFGLSCSYAFGDLSRELELWGTIYPASGYALWLDQDLVHRTELSLAGFSYNFGLAWTPSTNCLLGLAVIPPSSVRIESVYTVPGLSYPDGMERRFEDRFRFKLPVVAVGSVMLRPLTPLSLTADVSLWGKRSVSTDAPGWFWPPSFGATFKLALGAEYEIRLPLKVVRSLFLRAGYIHDRQPYSGDESVFRECATAGAGIDLGSLAVDLAAKVDLSPRESGRFYTNSLHLSVAYHF